MRIAAFAFGFSLLVLGVAGFVITVENRHPFHAWGMLVIIFGGILMLGVLQAGLRRKSLSMRLGNVRISGIQDARQMATLKDQLLGSASGFSTPDERDAAIIRAATDAGLEASIVEPYAMA
ncbi:MAG: hypothetical protein MK085_00745 [Phycisphaerales bacterium]|nr:hypothetical protein [Phycisphaerales bacterium]